MTTGAQALAQAVVRLRAAGVADAPRDARRLLAHVLGIAPGRVTQVLPDEVAADALARFERAVAARVKRQPVSQIVGFRDFWGRRFQVTPDVLDPRPETETLIAEALQKPAARLLDLGTGSGCILLTLLAEWPGAYGVGTDRSKPALDIARANAVHLGLTDRAEMHSADWFDGVAGEFDLIVSNPPYIAAAEMSALDPEVRDWEPREALTPGGDGLDAYRVILPGAVRKLRPGGRVLLEIGAGQGADVLEIGAAAGFGQGRLATDFDGRDRVACFALPRRNG